MDTQINDGEADARFVLKNESTYQNSSTVRLVDGPSEWEGRLEVRPTVNDSWGTICNQVSTSCVCTVGRCTAVCPFICESVHHVVAYSNTCNTYHNQFMVRTAFRGTGGVCSVYGLDLYRAGLHWTRL